MANKSLTKNSIYYVIYNILNLLFPLFTGIYVARMLSTSDIGEIQYAGNIAQYFVILSCLGIPTYGMREIAKVRDDKEELNKLYSELFIINLISTIVCFAIFLFLVLIIDSFRAKLIIFLIMGSLIGCNALNISWLFQGLEEFQFISLRNIISKIVVFCSLLVFVRSEDDYLKYAIINVIGTVGIYVIGILYAPRHVHLVKNGLKFRRHIKPVFTLVIVNLAIEIYSLVDVTMLGNLSEKANVTYYTYGHRIQQILLQVINSFTVVIVPRLSNYYAKQEYDNYNDLISKTLKVIMLLSCPAIIGILFTSHDLLCFLYGDSFYRSSIVLSILAPLLLISPIGYLLGSRVLLVTGEEKKMPLCVGIGAVVNIIGNAFLISRYNEYGAAVASLISEIVVMLVYIYFGKEKYKLVGIKDTLIKIIVSLVVMGGMLFSFTYVKCYILIKLFIEICGSVFIYFGLLYLLKEETVLRYSKQLKNKFFCKK